MTTEKRNVYQRVHDAAEAIQGRIAKGGENTFQKYKYASHDDVVEAVRPHIINAGLVITCDVVDHECTLETVGGKATMIAKGTMVATAINIDTPEDKYSVSFPVMCFDTSDKAIGKMISYGKKYALLAMLGLLIPTGEDQDAATPEAPPAKGYQPNEKTKETQDAKKTLRAEIIALKDAQKWSNERAAEITEAALGKGKTCQTATPAELQRVVDKMRAERDKELRQSEAAALIAELEAPTE